MGSLGAGLCDTCYSQDIEAQRRAWERESALGWKVSISSAEYRTWQA